MNELDIALMRRAVERHLKRQGRSLREAKTEVARMSMVELEWAAKPELMRRVGARWSR